jgi:cysteinyl-tRNA synthetase
MPLQNIQYAILVSLHQMDLKVGARIDAGEHKEDALDFTLWKKAKSGEISWDMWKL